LVVRNIDDMQHIANLAAYHKLAESYPVFIGKLRQSSYLRSIAKRTNS
jgi:hypothetical protein